MLFLFSLLLLSVCADRQTDRPLKEDFFSPSISFQRAYFVPIAVGKCPRVENMHACMHESKRKHIQAIQERKKKKKIKKGIWSNYYLTISQLCNMDQRCPKGAEIIFKGKHMRKKLFIKVIDLVLVVIWEF